MLKPNLDELIICRNLLKDEVFAKLAHYLKDTQNKKLQHDIISDLITKAEKHNLSGNLISSYAIYLLAQGNNIAALMIERNGKIGQSLYLAFKDDMETILQLLKVMPSDLFTTQLLDAYQPTKATYKAPFIALQNNIIAATTSSELADTFIDYYRIYGFGDIANYRAFHWDEEKTLVGIKHFDNMRLADLIGYERQKNMLVVNTEAFLDDKPANNVLLVGARGTGKSSAVKALANEYYNKRLRLLEITKRQLIHLPKIMETLRSLSSKKFILFLDDLSFEDFEIEYKYLKSAIEGGVESKPDNVLIYATSNRRHLIKETWKDRGESNDEIHRADSVNETISLSDRFGLTIHYLAPNQEEFLHIIASLLKRHSIELDSEDLRLQALRWEQTHSGRSGRVAQQFVTHYLGTINS